MTAADALVVLGMALAVYLPKVLPLVVVSERLTSRLRRWLRYVAPAVLGALVAPSIIAPAGHVAQPTWQQAGYVVAFVAAVLTRRMIPSLAVGMATVILIAIVVK